MTKQELKKLIKPVVQETIKEMLLDGGLLSTMVEQMTEGYFRGSKKMLLEMAKSNMTGNVPQQQPRQPSAVVSETKKNLAKNPYMKNMMEEEEEDPYGDIPIDYSASNLKKGEESLKEAYQQKNELSGLDQDTMSKLDPLSGANSMGVVTSQVSEEAIAMMMSRGKKNRL